MKEIYPLDNKQQVEELLRELHREKEPQNIKPNAIYGNVWKSSAKITYKKKLSQDSYTTVNALIILDIYREIELLTSEHNLRLITDTGTKITIATSETLRNCVYNLFDFIQKEKTLDH